MGLGGGGVVSIPPGAGGRWAGPATAGWLSWTAMRAGVGAGGPGGCPGWRWSVAWCSVAGETVFQAQVMAPGVGSSPQGCWSGQSICPGARGSCWCRSGLSKLPRGACGERRLLRPRCGCGAGWVQGCRAALGAQWGVGPRPHVGAVGTESSVQKTRRPAPPRLRLCSPACGSSPLSPDHPDLTALHVPGRRPDPDTPRGPKLGTALQGQESLLFSFLSVPGRDQHSAPLPIPDQTRGQLQLSGEVLSILSSEYVAKEIHTPAQKKPLPVPRTGTLAVFRCSRDRLTLFLQSKADSWEGSSLRSELLGHLGQGEYPGFTASPNRVISAGRFTGREMSLLRFSLSMAMSCLVVLLPDLALPTSVAGSALVEAGSLLTNTCSSKNGFQKRVPTNSEAS